MKQTLLILGNGFDLSLGLKTSYTNFVEYIVAKEEMSNNNLFSKLKLEHETKGWVDIEVSLKKYVLEFSKMGKELDEKVRKEQAKIVKKEFDEIRNILNEYIQRGQFDGLSPLRKHRPYDSSSNAAKVFTAIKHKENIEVLSFNYTNLTLLGLEMGNGSFDWVHGSCEDHIVFGADDDNNISEEYGFILKSVQKRKSYFIEKKLREADRVIIFGHSLGETDFHYFSQFFKDQSNSLLSNFKSKEIYIFTKSRSDIYSNLRRMDDSISFQRLRDVNDFFIFTEEDKMVDDYFIKEIEKW